MRYFPSPFHLFISFTILCFHSIHAAEIERYLYPYPQKLAFQKTSKPNNFSTADIEEIQQFVYTALPLKIEGEITLHLASGKSFQFNFHIDSTRLQEQAYKIKLEGSQVKITGHKLQGLYYAKQTFHQVLNYFKTEQLDIVNLEIHDWPNFARRGYMLDISRDKVPTMSTIYRIIQNLASWKINEFQLYVEHTYAYKNHETVWKNASPILPEEIQLLDQYCKARFIDLVPNQNSFGHMENWLKHDAYLDLAECPDDCNTVWGMRKRSSLNPTDPRSLQLMQELYAEYLPNFSSPYCNIGCDETVELGLGRSKDSCKEIGQGQVYLNYLNRLNEAVNEHGKRAQFWGDIIESYPKLIPKLPKNMTALVWGYEGDFPFEKKLPKFKKAEIPFYVCPGTSSWRSLIGKNNNAFDNLRNAAIFGMKNKATGYLNTDWGDYGHWQPLSISYPTQLLGAQYAWNYRETAIIHMDAQVNEVFFQDSTGRLSQALLKLGNAYQKSKNP
ncbi:MAG: beta-N-acetylhexosaminidase [Bacteroidetes bacterium]|nr:beta-N-acetylhexosaminidase [Bacteroidota bacterium]